MAINVFEKASQASSLPNPPLMLRLNSPELALIALFSNLLRGWFDIFVNLRSQIDANLSSTFHSVRLCEGGEDSPRTFAYLWFLKAKEEEVLYLNYELKAVVEN